MYKSGYYKNNIYRHSPESERVLFYDSLMDYIGIQKDQKKILGIEIGVLNGETSQFLLSLHEKICLIGIDPIVPDSMEASLIGSEEKIISNTAIYRDRFIFYKEYSHKLKKVFSPGIYDFVFIDGDHRYKAVKKDYKLFKPLLKQGGLIYFHDSRQFRGGAPFHEGSSKYVEKLIRNDKSISLIGEAFSLTLFRVK